MKQDILESEVFYLALLWSRFDRLKQSYNDLLVELDEIEGLFYYNKYTSIPTKASLTKLANEFTELKKTIGDNKHG